MFNLSHVEVPERSRIRRSTPAGDPEYAKQIVERALRKKTYDYIIYITKHRTLFEDLTKRVGDYRIAVWSVDSSGYCFLATGHNCDVMLAKTLKKYPQSKSRIVDLRDKTKKELKDYYPWLLHVE